MLEVGLGLNSNQKIKIVDVIFKIIHRRITN